jgi:predicted GIY-YIG superfamily endonuclease
MYYQMPCSKCKQTGHNARTCSGNLRFLTGQFQRSLNATRFDAPFREPTVPEQPEPLPQLGTESIVVTENSIPPSVKVKRFYCYILGQTNFLNKSPEVNRGRGGYAGGTPRTYNGYTVDLRHRLRQHNGEIKGGAFATKNRGPWEFIAVMTCLEWTNVRAMKVEWLIRYPTRKKPRPTEFSGPQGRINGLIEVVNRMDEPSIHLYVNPLFYDSVRLPEKVKLFRSMDSGF